VRAELYHGARHITEDLGWVLSGYAFLWVTATMAASLLVAVRAARRSRSPTLAFTTALAGLSIMTLAIWYVLPGTPTIEAWFRNSVGGRGISQE
jgi:uncharacterized membrane protein